MHSSHQRNLAYLAQSPQKCALALFADIAVKAFELSQNLRAKWLTADYAVKRPYLEIVFLNFILDDVTLVHCHS